MTTKQFSLLALHSCIHISDIICRFASVVDRCLHSTLPQLWSAIHCICSSVADEEIKQISRKKELATRCSAYLPWKMTQCSYIQIIMCLYSKLL